MRLLPPPRSRAISASATATFFLRSLPQILPPTSLFAARRSTPKLLGPHRCPCLMYRHEKVAGEVADGLGLAAPPPRPMPMRSSGACCTAGTSIGNLSPNLWSMDPRPPGGFMSYFQHQ